jgi:hypothetical protein
MIGKTMTTRRHRQKRPLFRRMLPATVVLVVGSALIGALGSIPGSRAATTEQIVTDRNSGLAILGFDPVAYFIDGAAVAGKDDFEYSFAGVVWRFRNEGNRGAFIDNPDFYVPRFGGHDPVGVARGVALPGNPRLWLMAGERLYLFHAPQAKDAFARDPDPVIAAADERWPQVQQLLSP